MSDDIWSQKTEYFDDGVKFGTGPEMIAQIKSITRQLEEARGRIGELEIEMQKLQDPASVHLNMLAGRIAKITMMQCAHTHGEEAVREFRAKDARIAELEAALKQLTDLINLREWILQGTPEEILQAFRKAHAALEGESREAGD